MLVNIDGNLINTELIWKITPVKKLVWDNGGSFLSGFKETVIERATKVSFWICIVGKETIEICINVSDYKLETKEQILKNFKEEYDKLIIIWSKSQRNIQEMNFKVNFK